MMKIIAKKGLYASCGERYIADTSLHDESYHMKGRWPMTKCFSLVVAAMLVWSLVGCQQPETLNATYAASASPRIVEIGTVACLPCALMRPGLDEIKAEYAGRLQVEVIDTLFNPEAKTQYNAPLCATQVYIAASGKELYRHVGYSSKGDILAKWKELGVDLDAPAKQREPQRAVAPRRQNPGT